MELRIWHTLPISIVILLAVGLGVMNYSNVSMQEVPNDGVLTYHSAVCKGYVHDGVYYDLGCSHNTLTNDGKELIEDWISSNNASYINTIVLGNGTEPTATDTSHPGKIADCGLTEATITWTDIGIGNQSASYEWTSTCDNEVVNTTGLESDGNIYFAGNAFTDVTLQTDDKINVTWYVWVT